MAIEEVVLALGGHQLKDYSLPEPIRSESLGNREYLNEISYNIANLEQMTIDKEKLLTDEQMLVYKKVIESVDTNVGKIVFLDALGGTGTTYLINLLLSKIRSTRNIALAVASSGIAATLLEGGKTAHAAFKLPLKLACVETPLCNISKQSIMAKVLKDTKLIVWDERTMAHKGLIEALKRSLKGIRDSSDLMGGVTLLLAGDFRQTLPVVSRGTRADEIRSCIKKSYLWPLIMKLKLTKNIGDTSAGMFSDFLLDIGNEDYPESDGIITIPRNLCSVVRTVADLIAKIYPDLTTNILNKKLEWFCERAILTPKNDKATAINDEILKSFQGEESEYKSVDTVVNKDDAVNYPTEFLNTLKPPGLPNHKFNLKVGAPIMLLRNLNPPKLCNGTRLQITALHNNVIEAIILIGCSRGEEVFIPRIPLIPSDFPFEFKRLQFPLKVCFAMTINKSQGQTLKLAGVDLREDCFSHGQFYVACSRVSSPSSLTILTTDRNLKNVVYKEVLQD